MDRWKNTIVLSFICIFIFVFPFYISLAFSGSYQTYLPIIFKSVGSTIPVKCEASSTSGYISCIDDNGNIEVEVPNYWTDVIGDSWTFDDLDIGVSISAAPSLSEYKNNHDAEGVFISASNNFAQIGGYIEFLDYYTNAYREDCTLEGRFSYDDGLYRGKYDRYSNCGSKGYAAYILCAVDKVDPVSKLILIQIQVYPDDTTTVLHILGSFKIFY